MYSVQRTTAVLCDPKLSDSAGRRATQRRVDVTPDQHNEHLDTVDTGLHDQTLTLLPALSSALLRPKPSQLASLGSVLPPSPLPPPVDTPFCLPRPCQPFRGLLPEPFRKSFGRFTRDCIVDLRPDGSSVPRGSDSSSLPGGIRCACRAQRGGGQREIETGALRAFRAFRAFQTISCIPRLYEKCVHDRE